MSASTRAAGCAAAAAPGRRPEGEGDPPSVEADATVARPQLQLVAEQPAEIVEQVAANGRVQPVTAQVDACPSTVIDGQPADAVRPIEDLDGEALVAVYHAAASPAGPAPITAMSTESEH